MTNAGATSRGGTGGAVARVGIGVGSSVGVKIALAGAAIILGLLCTAGLFAASSSSATGTGTVCTGTGGVKGAPPKLIPIYIEASAKYRLGPKGPAILASINEIESGFGTNMGPSEAGAEGWMQFMPETWTAYGVDANGDGRKDPYDPEDAIHAAAGYLKASGAPGDWYTAIFAYNHADWYVQEVLAGAKKFENGEAQVICRPSELGEVPEEALQRIEYFARWIESKHLPYCWGGGHGSKPGPDGGESGCSPVGLDCSGSVRWLLVLTGYNDPGGLVSGQFAGAEVEASEPGPGRAVTIWSNASHVFITINGRDWGTSKSNTNSGPGYAAHTKEGFFPSHPKGL